MKKKSIVWLIFLVAAFLGELPKHPTEANGAGTKGGRKERERKEAKAQGENKIPAKPSEETALAKVGSKRELFSERAGTSCY